MTETSVVAHAASCIAKNGLRMHVDDARTEGREVLLVLIAPRREGYVGGKSRSRGVGDWEGDAVREAAVLAGNGEAFMERDCELGVSMSQCQRRVQNVRCRVPCEVLASCMPPDNDRVMWKHGVSQRMRVASRCALINVRLISQSSRGRTSAGSRRLMMAVMITCFDCKRRRQPMSALIEIGEHG
jgi:hypothetical protein